MGAPRKLPPSDVLLQLRTQGWTYADIASEYGVGTSAVYLQLRQAKAVTPQQRHKDLIPWHVKTAHAHSHPLTMLRLLGRRDRGEDLPPAKARMLEKWLRDVKEVDVVLCYDPDFPVNPASPTVGGFYYSRRRPEDGDSLTRCDDPKSSLDAATFSGATGDQGGNRLGR